MKIIRKTIRNILNEIFDNPTLPTDLKLIKGSGSLLYKFETDKNNYCVLFEVYNTFSKDTPTALASLTKDDRINDILIAHNNAYFLNWGLCDGSSYIPFDNVKTNSGEEIYVFNSVFAIISNFFKTNEPDVVFYQAIKKRKLIYDKMFDKTNMSNYEKVHGLSNTFLIKKDLI